MTRDGPAEWAASLWHALPEAQRPATARELEPVVESAWKRALDAHRAFSIPATEWFASIGGRLGDGTLAGRHVEDLYLACGCERGDPAALQLFEQEVLPAVARRLAHLRLARDQLEDLLQVLRERMLVPTGERRGIAGYDGRAPLAVWLQVVAARLGLRQHSRDRRQAPASDSELDQIAPGVPDPSLAYLKRLYGAQFRTAFAEAIESLPARARNLLRHAVMDELGIDQIAAIYHIHRATAARQLKQARESLIEETRVRMRALLKVSETELESIMRGVLSMADVTLRNVLGRGRGRGHA